MTEYKIEPVQDGFELVSYVTKETVFLPGALANMRTYRNSCGIFPLLEMAQRAKEIAEKFA